MSCPHSESVYDEIWVYGMKDMCDPFEGMNMPPSVMLKTRYTGYLRRNVPAVNYGPAPVFGDDPTSWSPPAAATGTA